MTRAADSTLTSSHDKGRSGEQAVTEYLEKKGYGILARNFRSRTGEVDIVCEAGPLILFIEVKSWAAFAPEALGPAIGSGKQKRIVQTARYYLLQNPHLRDRGVRFDVVLINPKAGTIRHIEGAFEAECPE